MAEQPRSSLSVRKRLLRVILISALVFGFLYWLKHPSGPSKSVLDPSTGKTTLESPAPSPETPWGEWDATSVEGLHDAKKRRRDRRWPAPGATRIGDGVSCIQRWAPGWLTHSSKGDSPAIAFESLYSGIAPGKTDEPPRPTRWVVQARSPDGTRGAFSMDKMEATQATAAEEGARADQDDGNPSGAVYRVKIYAYEEGDRPGPVDETEVEDPFEFLKNFQEEKFLLDERVYEWGSSAGQITLKTRNGRIYALSLAGTPLRCDTASGAETLNCHCSVDR